MVLFQKIAPTSPLGVLVLLLTSLVIAASLWFEFGPIDSEINPSLFRAFNDSLDESEGDSDAFHPLAFKKLSHAFLRDCASRPLATASSSSLDRSQLKQKFPLRDSLQLFKRQVARDLAHWYAKGSITLQDLQGRVNSFARLVKFTDGRFVSNFTAYGFDPRYKVPAHFAGLEPLLPRKSFAFLLSEKDEPIALPGDDPSALYDGARDLPKRSWCVRANFGDAGMKEANAPELAAFATTSGNQSLADLHGFFINPSSFVATNTRAPVFSQCKTACYVDLLYPGKFHFDEWKYRDGKKRGRRKKKRFAQDDEAGHASPGLRGDASLPLDQDEIPWENKADAMFWRGSISGGYNSLVNHKRMHRIRLLEWARLYGLRHPNRTFTHNADPKARFNSSAFDVPDFPMIDVGTFKLLQADLSVHNELINTYGLKPSVAFKEIFRYKYILVVDGNTWPSRLRRWLDTNSVIFYSGIFHDWWSAHLVPWQHYIPVKLDYSDLEENLLWAREHDSEARAIMERARDLMRYFNRREHLDCYLRLLLEEYQNLWQD